MGPTAVCSREFVVCLPTGGGRTAERVGSAGCPHLAASVYWTGYPLRRPLSNVGTTLPGGPLIRSRCCVIRFGSISAAFRASHPSGRGSASSDGPGRLDASLIDRHPAPFFQKGSAGVAQARLSVKKIKDLVRRAKARSFSGCESHRQLSLQRSSCTRSEATEAFGVESPERDSVNMQAVM